MSSRIIDATISFFDLTKVVILVFVLAVVAVMVLGVPLPVSGQSMEPNFKSGQVVVVERLSFAGSKEIKRGDVVAAKFPADPAKTKLIKRVIGLPGETVHAQEGKIFIDGTELNETIYAPLYGAPPYVEQAAVTLKEGEYFLAGDNRPGSSDSRLWGAVQQSDIQGKVAFVIWPLGAMSYVDRVSY